jgi:hypothetical protein
VGLNIANGIAVPICNPTLTTCTSDLRVQADVNGTHLVADVVGYFERFPKEQARSFISYGSSVNTFNLGTSCVHVTGGAAVITAPVPGKIVVQAHMAVELNHENGSDDNVYLSLAASQGDCDPNGPGTGRARVFSSYPTGQITTTVIAEAVFDVPAGTHSFYLNGVRSGSGVAQIHRVLTIATFQPN